jgi:hypothetical protein
MTYLEARNSGYPFNRRKYIDGWYIRDLRRNVDYAQRDLSQRFWTQADLEATDWWTEHEADRLLWEEIERLRSENINLKRTVKFYDTFPAIPESIKKQAKDIKDGKNE